MIDISAQDLSLIKKILHRIVPYCETRVFGSRVKKTAKAYSDIDIALVHTEKIPRNILNELEQNFQESDITIRVDIIDWNRISENFKKIIEEKYVVI